MSRMDPDRTKMQRDAARYMSQQLYKEAETLPSSRRSQGQFVPDTKVSQTYTFWVISIFDDKDSCYYPPTVWGQANPWLPIMLARMAPKDRNVIIDTMSDNTGLTYGDSELMRFPLGMMAYYYLDLAKLMTRSLRHGNRHGNRHNQTIGYRLMPVIRRAKPVIPMVFWYDQ